MSNQVTPDEPDQPLEEEGEPEETETEDGGEVEATEEHSEGKQVEEAAPAPADTTKGSPAARTAAQSAAWKEDPNDFDESTVEIAITLHPLKGRPAEERLVTFCIHNHSGPPVTNYYTQGELTDQSPLDRLLWAIAQEIRKFRAELSRRKQEQYERDEQARRSRREQKPAPPARVGTPAAAPTAVASAGGHAAPAVQNPQASPVPAARKPQASPAPAKTTKQGNELVQQPLF